MDKLFLKKRLTITLLVFFIAIPHAFSQQSDFVGYYNGSKPELARELLIMPDKHFMLPISYGAVDQLIVGTWKQEGNKITMEEAKKETPPAFTVYGRKDEEIEKGKLFSFLGTDRNMSIAFSFTDTLALGSFKLLHLPGQHIFNRKERLNVISKPVKNFFLAERPGYKPIGYTDENTADQDNLYTIYQFTPADSVNDILVYYNPPSATTPLVINAVLKNDELYFTSKDGESLFGRKEDSPYDYKESLDYAMKATQVPNSISANDGNFYHSLKPVKSFKTPLSIDPNKAFFEEVETEEGGGDFEPPSVEELKAMEAYGTQPSPAKTISKKQTVQKKKPEGVKKRKPVR